MALSQVWGWVLVAIKLAPAKTTAWELGFCVLEMLLLEVFSPGYLSSRLWDSPPTYPEPITVMTGMSVM